MDDNPPRMSQRWMLGIAALVAVVLLIGVIAGGALNIGRNWFKSDPETVASSALQSMRAQNRLVPFVARYVAVVSSRQTRLGGLISTERTLILPGDVRYELDLSKLDAGDVRFDKATSTLSVTLPNIEIAGPEVDLKAAREYGNGALIGSLTSATGQLDQVNRDRAVTDLRAQAAGEVPMRLAREAGRRAVEQTFALPLAAAGFDRVKVVARYAGEGAAPPPEYIDASRSYNEVLGEARQRR